MPATQIKIRAVPVGIDPAHHGILTDLKSAVEQLQGQLQAPQAVTGLTATPIAGGVVVQFTRSAAVNFRLYISDSANRTKARVVDLGSNNQYTDNIGQGGVKRWYWVQGYSAGLTPSDVSAPVSATSLALGTAATVTPPKDASYLTVFDTTINATRPVIYGTDKVQAPKGGPQ